MLAPRLQMLHSTIPKTARESSLRFECVPSLAELSLDEIESKMVVKARDTYLDSKLDQSTRQWSSLHWIGFRKI